MPLSIPDLKSTDVGREVRYDDKHGKVEVGRITSWNKQWIFVRYTARILPTRFVLNGATSQATDPTDLEFCV